MSENSHRVTIRFLPNLPVPWQETKERSKEKERDKRRDAPRNGGDDRPEKRRREDAKHRDDDVVMIDSSHRPATRMGTARNSLAVHPERERGSTRTVSSYDRTDRRPPNTQYAHSTRHERSDRRR